MQNEDQATDDDPTPELAPQVQATVGPDGVDERLDTFLSRLPQIASRSEARALLDAGLVAVDGQPEKPSFALKLGQVVTFRPRIETDPVVALGVRTLQSCGARILYEDAHILVIAKPPGLSAHPPERRGDTSANVAHLALKHCGELPRLGGEDRPGIVHRLDKDTSGVMVIARTEQAFHALQSQFKARSVQKEYRAICYGESRFDSDHIARNIATHPTAPDRMIVVDQGGRESETYYEVVERFTGFTHFRCKPRSGRTHQIRVHMMSIGHSLVADRVYRARNQVHLRLPEGAPDPGRQCLHAARLEFAHPHTEERMVFEQPIPEDMEQLLAWLRIHKR